MILIDTHVVMWLYQGDLRRIPAAVERRIEREPVGVSPFTQVELGYMHEIGRIRPSAQSVIDELGARLGLVIADVGAAAVCRVAVGLSWTRDPFDRLLAAHATVARLPLITKDEVMRRHLPLAWWAD